MNGTKYWAILDENLFRSVNELRLGPRFILQLDNNPKHATKARFERFKAKNLNVLTWSN